MKKKRKKKTACAVNSLQGLVSVPDVPDWIYRDALSLAANLSASGHHDAEARSFAIEVAENVVAKWDTVLWNKQMFIMIPNVLPAVASKVSFVTLLEVAEEDLGCENVICCIPSSTSEMANHLRTFAFMGFQRILPGSRLLPTQLESPGKFVFLACEL